MSVVRRFPKPPAAAVAVERVAEAATAACAQGPARGIAEHLLAFIHSGEVAPGEHLNEAALALRMGTSRGEWAHRRRRAASGPRRSRSGAM